MELNSNSAGQDLERSSTENLYRESEMSQVEIQSLEIASSRKPEIDSEFETLLSQKNDTTDKIQDTEEYPPHFITRFRVVFRPFCHAIIWLLLTAYVGK